MATINFNTAAATNTSSTPEHRVYTRSTWGSAWTLRPDLAAVQCVWAAAPQASTATLNRHYGRVILPGGTVAADYAALDLSGQFVLIEWDTDEGSIAYWLGVIDSTSTSPDGTTDGSVPASGVQCYAAFGMERLLQVSPIRDTVWKDGDSTFRGGSASGFNILDGQWEPNRSETKVGGAYVFDPNGTKYWSTRDIIEHLLTYHLPTNSGGVASIPWMLAAPNLAPDWDTPQFETEGQTVYNILNYLLTPRLLLGWGVGFNNASLLVVPFSLAPTGLSLNKTVFPANTTQHFVFSSTDPLTRTEIAADNLDVVDQVIVRGAKRISVCTLEIDSGLAEGWSSATAYNTGASGEAGYSDLDQNQKRQANERVRRGGYLSDVFSMVKIPADWDFTGLGSENVFEGADESTPHKPYLSSLRILSDLPLLRGVDYSGSVGDVDETEGTGARPPLVTLENPEVPGERVDVSTLGNSFLLIPTTMQPITWSVSTRIGPEPRQFSLIVHGAPQHAIGGSAFTPLDVDSDVYGGFDISTVAATVAIEDDRFCEAAYPETIATTDVVRRRVVHVGNAYQQVYIVPGTVVGIDWQSTEETSDGGYIRDDTEKLKEIARLFAAYHTSARRSVVINTMRRTGLVSIGDMIAAVDGTTIGAVVTRIQIDAPLGYSQPPRNPQQTIIASATPLDLLATLQAANRR